MGAGAGTGRTLLLHLERVGRLYVQVRRVLVLDLAATKEAKTARGAGEALVRLRPPKVSKNSAGSRAPEGRDLPSGGELAGLAPCCRCEGEGAGSTNRAFV